MDDKQEREREQELILHNLGQLWKKYPQLRFCQLVVNVANAKHDPFFTSDEDFASAMLSPFWKSS
jgi:hypothetical protein